MGDPGLFSGDSLASVWERSGVATAIARVVRQAQMKAEGQEEEPKLTDRRLRAGIHRRRD